MGYTHLYTPIYTHRWMNTPSQQEVNWQPHHKKQQETTCTDPSISYNAQLGEVKRSPFKMLDHLTHLHTHSHTSTHHTMKSQACRSGCFAGVISHPHPWATGATGLWLIHLPALKWKCERQSETKWEDVICIYRSLRLQLEQAGQKRTKSKIGKIKCCLVFF